MFRTKNPTLREEIFQREAFARAGSETMSVGGTMAKTAILLVILALTASVTWANPSVGWILLGCLAGFGVAIATFFRPQWAPVTAPVYAALEGLALGAISAFYAAAFAGTKYSGIVPLAILGTFGVLAVMLFLYTTRIIRVTQTFKMVVIGATLAIALTYAATIMIGFFVPGMYSLPMYQSGPIGILFSVVVIVIASMNLALDFAIVEGGVETGAPKYMEWYAGFSLLVTLVWIYLEMLRLLSKLAGGRR